MGKITFVPPGLTYQEWLIYCWQYHKRCGWMLGDFWSRQMEAMAYADDENLELLARAFPEEVGGLRRFRSESGWWDEVERKGDEFMKRQEAQYV